MTPHRIGDLAESRARISVADLLAAGGVRPVNLVKRSGDTLRLALQADVLAVAHGTEPDSLSWQSRASVRSGPRDGQVKLAPATAALVS